MKEPSRESIRRVFDCLGSYFIVMEKRAIEAEKIDEIAAAALRDAIVQWREEVGETVEYLNWIAYRDQEWYKKWKERSDGIGRGSGSQG